MINPSTTAPISEAQRASADFYGRYFWKNYAIKADGHLHFVVQGFGKKRLEQACTLLDIGAGSGKFSILLKQQFPHLNITAVDLSQDNIDTMDENARQTNTAITAKQASALDLPFESNTFDLVLCAYMLQHTDNPQRGFAEAARVLKPGGSVFFAIGCDNGLGGLHQKTRGFFKRVPASLRTPSVWPALPFYWAATHVLKRNKASYRELTKDMVDWLYNPLQNFVPEPDICTWFHQNNLAFEHLGYTGLFKSMMLSRGTKKP